jgi:RsiW-degrading membrane proteinase PrsW (M82 family)
MLTRFFGTSKPLAVVVVIIYMTLGFFYSNRQWVIEPFNWQETLRLVGMWLLFISTMFILNFVAQKNDLTKRSAYGVLLLASHYQWLYEMVRYYLQAFLYS